MCRPTVPISRAWPSSLFGAGAFEPLKLRACHAPSYQGFTHGIPARHSPQSFLCATPWPDADCVLETPPLPVTPPRCEDR